MATRINCEVRVIVLAVLVWTQLPLMGQASEWYSTIKQIKLLETKRSEVEKLLRPIATVEGLKGAVGTDVDYQVDRNVSVSVLYSNGFCTPGSEYGYDVDKDTAIEIDIVLKRPFAISTFGFDLTRFEKVELEDVVGLFTYTNEEDGLRFSGSANKLSRISLSPAKKQEQLACENR